MHLMKKSSISARSTASLALVDRTRIFSFCSSASFRSRVRTRFVSALPSLRNSFPRRSRSGAVCLCNKGGNKWGKKSGQPLKMCSKNKEAAKISYAQRFSLESFDGMINTLSGLWRRLRILVARRGREQHGRTAWHLLSSQPSANLTLTFDFTICFCYGRKETYR